MTSPVIIQTPGALDTARDAFMQALQQGRQLTVQRQQLELEKRRVASLEGLQGAEAEQARAEAAKAQAALDAAQRAHDAATQANTIFSGLAANGTIDDPAAVTTAFAGIKDPDVHAAFGTFYSDYLQSKQTKATAAHLDAQARVLGQQADFDAKIAPIVDQLIANPTAPLPANPTAREAVAMARTGVLGLIEERLRIEAASSASGAAESATQRQVLMGVYNRAHSNFAAAQRSFEANTRQYNAQVQNARMLRQPVDSIAKPEPPPDFGSFLDQEAQAAGTDTVTVNSAVRGLLQNFKAAQKNPAQRLDAPSGSAALFAETVYKGSDPVTRQQLWEAAAAVAQGAPLGTGGTDEQRNWISRAALLIKRHSKLSQ